MAAITVSPISAANVIAINTYGVLMFDLNTFPDWANSTIAKVHQTLNCSAH
jgi:hypothetical protein